MNFIYNNKKYKLLYLTLSGSRLYGTNYDKGQHPLDKNYISDYDYKGVIIEDLNQKTITLEKNIEEIEPKTLEEKTELISIIQEKINYKFHIGDIVLYDLIKFSKLIEQNNPNIMDVLFAPKDKIIYCDEKFNLLLEQKNNFLTKKIKNTFIGYSESQLKKINTHSKWLGKYPYIHQLVNSLIDALNNNLIDNEWINKYFNEEVSSYILKEKEKVLLNNVIKNTILKNEIDYKNNIISKTTFLELYNLNTIANNNYFKPEIIDYSHPKDLNNHGFYLDLNYNKEMTYKEFLIKNASFRKVSESLLIIYDNGNGILNEYNKIRARDYEIIGKFEFLLSIDKFNYDKDYDEFIALWNWKINRNVNRNILEEKYGYDVKHAMHLYRLLLSTKSIIINKTYNPSFIGNELELLKNILIGKYSFDEIITMAENLKKEIDVLFEKKLNNFNDSVDIKFLETILLKIIK